MYDVMKILLGEMIFNFSDIKTSWINIKYKNSMLEPHKRLEEVFPGLLIARYKAPRIVFSHCFPFQRLSGQTCHKSYSNCEIIGLVTYQYKVGDIQYAINKCLLNDYMNSYKEKGK